MLRRLHFLALSSVIVLTTAASAHAQGRIDCNAINSRILKQVLHYCVMLPTNYDSVGTDHSTPGYPVLYFLHGLGDNEQSLFKGGGWQLIEDLRQQHKIGDFLIVAPEGGRTFYINSADGRLRYNDFFLREFMPFIEAKYPVRRERSARGITGVSMGGYGALRFAFAHPELFGSVSAQSAALMQESPQQLNVAMHSDTSFGKLLGNVFGNPLNIPHWKQNDPFVLARVNRSAISRVAVYFNCGDEDQFGFEKGAAALDRQLRAEGIKHEFHLYEGDHSAAYFLSHLGETMRFHSRVFAGSK